MGECTGRPARRNGAGGRSRVGGRRERTAAPNDPRLDRRPAGGTLSHALARLARPCSVLLFLFYRPHSSDRRRLGRAPGTRARRRTYEGGGPWSMRTRGRRRGWATRGAGASGTRSGTATSPRDEVASEGERLASFSGSVARDRSRPSLARRRLSELTRPAWPLPDSRPSTFFITACSDIFCTTKQISHHHCTLVRQESAPDVPPVTPTWMPDHADRLAAH